jgi:hypothetical protein
VLALYKRQSKTNQEKWTFVLEKHDIN